MVEGLGVSIPDLLMCTCSSANHVKTEWSVSHNPKGDREELGLFRPFLDYSRKSVSTKTTNSLTTTAMRKRTWPPQCRQQALHHRTLHAEARRPFTRDFWGKISFHTSSSHHKCDNHRHWCLHSAYYPRGSATCIKQGSDHSRRTRAWTWADSWAHSLSRWTLNPWNLFAC